MSTLQTAARNLGAEIPYRRPKLDTRTGSLVFDRHLDQTLTEAVQAPGSRKRS